MTDKRQAAMLLLSCDEESYEEHAMTLWGLLDGGERETLRCLVKQGPVWDGDVPSKRGRTSLIELGLASKAVVNGQQGYQVANYVGWTVFKQGGLTMAPPSRRTIQLSEPTLHVVR